MHIRNGEGEGLQQQQPSNLYDADGFLRRSGLFKVAFIFVTFINSTKVSIPKELANTLKWVDLLAILGYFCLVLVRKLNLCEFLQVKLP